MTTHEPANWTYAYLSLSLALSLVWVALYVLRHDLRASMWVVSVYTALLAVTEPAFVPRYWNPFTIFNLARRTGFDLESVLFSFAIGGIVFAGYEFLFRFGPVETLGAERHNRRHRQHTLAVLLGPLLFGILIFATRLNPIYSSAIALIAGFAATLYCRRDLWLKMMVSGGLFFGLYFFAFVVFNLVFPGYVEAVWNLKAISGVLFMGVPLEEMMFAFTFGLYWSSVYEHVTWRGQRALAPALIKLKRSPT
ncbi:MAG: lycopene cyclase domain-containing protein [Candidatus Acidiferrales bacterium]